MSNTKILRGSIPLTKTDEDTVVVVEEKFSLLVPKGMMFSSDKEELADDRVFILYSTDGTSDIFSPDDIDFYGCARVRLRINETTIPFNAVYDLSNEDVRKVLETALCKMLANTDIQLGNSSKPGHLPPFVVKSDEEAIVIAACSGILGNASFLIALPSEIHTGSYCVFAADSSSEDFPKFASPAEYKATIKELLAKLGGPNPESRLVQPGQAAPNAPEEPACMGKDQVNVGAFLATVPEGMLCAVGGSGMPKGLCGRFELICVSKDYAPGFDEYENAPACITVDKPQWSAPLGFLLGNGVSGVHPFFTTLIAEAAGVQPAEDSLRIAKQEPGFLVCYCPCVDGDNADAPRNSFAFLIAAGEIYYTGSFRFGQDHDGEREKEVKNWLSGLGFAGDEAAKRVVLPFAREHLGPYCGENGKINALTVASLFADDVIFFPEKPFDRSSGNLSISPQFNISKQAEHPFLAEHLNDLLYSTADLFLRLDNCRELSVAGSKLHPKILAPLLDDRLTGLSFLNLMAYHMVRISSDDKNSDCFTVILDRNVAAGIPDAFRYICDFIRFMRNYNGITGPFSVNFAAAMNLSGPISEKLSPVQGSTEGQLSRGLLRLKVSGSGQVMPADGSDGDSPGSGSGSKELNIEQLKAELEPEIPEALKHYVSAALESYGKMREEIKAASFSGLKSIGEVIERLKDEVSFEWMNLLCIGGDVSLGFSRDAVYIERNRLSQLLYTLHCEYVCEEGKEDFDPNYIPGRLIELIDALNESEMYNTLLKSAVDLQNNGEVLVAPGSPHEKVLELKRQDPIELSGTQYEGRSERIENVKAGQELALVREPDNPHDPNSIDVRSPEGSVGHLPARVAGELAPLLDSGKVLCRAEAAEVVPLTDRSTKAKKAILKVHLSYSFNSPEAPSEYSAERADKAGGWEAERAAKEPIFKERAKARAAMKAENAKAEKLAKELGEMFDEKHAHTTQILDSLFDPNNVSTQRLNLQIRLKRAEIQLDELAAQAEHIMKHGMERYVSMKESISAASALKVIEAVQQVISDTEDLSVDVNGGDTFGAINYSYSPSFDMSRLKNLLAQEAAALKIRAHRESEERLGQEQEEADCAEAWKLGITSDELTKLRGYNSAMELMEKARSSNEFLEAAEAFEQLGGYKNSAALNDECLTRASGAEAARYNALEVLQEWEKSRNEALDKRQKFKKNLISKINMDFGQKAKKLKEETKSQLKPIDFEIKSLNISLESAQKQLLNTGFFRKARQRELLDTCNQLHDQIDELSRKMAETEARQEELLAELDNQKKKALESVDGKAMEAVPLPAVTQEVELAIQTLKAEGLPENK